MAFSVRMTEEEETLAKKYAALNGMSLGEAFKQALFEKIEDEYDIAVGEVAYEKYLNDPKTRTLKDLMGEEY
jgi:hypothetical protein